MQISTSNPTFSDFSKTTLAACEQMQSQVQKKYSAADQLNARELIYADYSVSVAYENKDLGTIKARFTCNTVSDVTAGDARYSNIFVTACISKAFPLFKLNAPTYTKVQNLLNKSFGNRTYLTLVPENAENPNNFIFVVNKAIKFNSLDRSNPITSEKLLAKILKFYGNAMTAKSETEELFQSPLPMSDPAPSSKPLAPITPIPSKLIVDNFSSLSKLTLERIGKLHELEVSGPSSTKSLPVKYEINVFNNTIGKNGFGSRACQILSDTSKRITLLFNIFGFIPVSVLAQSQLSDCLDECQKRAYTIEPSDGIRYYMLIHTQDTISKNMSWNYDVEGFNQLPQKEWRESELTQAASDFFKTVFPIY